MRQWASPPEFTIDVTRGYQAEISTSLGDVVVELFADEAPQTVNNFVFLASQSFYDGVKIHRVMKGFMIQTGDPRGDGTGGPGYDFADELVARSYSRGIVAMANRGPNTNGSQFFIVQGDNVQLPPNYTIFGQVSNGMDVVDAIADIAVTRNAAGELSRPVEDVYMSSVVILVS